MVPAGEDQGTVAFVFGGVRFEDFLQQCVILVFGRYCPAGAAHGRVERYEVSSSVLAQETKRVGLKGTLYGVLFLVVDYVPMQRYLGEGGCRKG